VSKVNIIGGTCVDLLMKNVDKEAFFKGKYKVESIKTSFGGDALNETTVLNKYTVDARLISSIGDDEFGKLVLNHLNDNHIKYNSNLIKKNTETSISFVFVDENGERLFVGNEDGALRLFDIDDIEIDEDCEIVSFASLFQSKMLNNEKLEELFSSIKKRNITLFVDSSNPKNNEKVNDLSFLKYIDFFFCNETEAKAICESDDLIECESILYSSGIKNVIIKCGEKGCLFETKHYKTSKIECVDTTGAGDSFVAGFIKAFLENKNIEECLKVANEFGSLACKYIGAAEWLKHI